MQTNSTDIQYPLDFKDLRYFITFRARNYSYENKGNIENVKLKKTPLCNISLYFPQSFSETLNQNWGEVAMLSGGTIVGKGINYLKGKMGEGAGLFNRINPGVIPNPSEELSYQGPGFRTFDFSFDLLATSKEELEVIKRIEGLFKILILPRLAPSATYIGFPAIWEIEISGLNIEDGNELFTLGFKDKYFALVDTTLQYTPDGSYQPTVDGHPIKTNLSLSFKETSPLYRKDLPGEQNINSVLGSIENFVGLG